MPSQPELEQTWQALQERLRDGIPSNVFRVWLEPLRAVALDDGVLYLEASQQTRDWIRRRFGTTLSSALASLDVSLRRVEVLADSEIAASPPSEAVARAATLKAAYRFEEFVIGASNRFAHAAALAVAELPAQAYNPLFLYGPAGVGKTHLLNAIGNYTVLNDSALAVRVSSTEAFTGEFTSAIRNGDMQAFKSLYRQADVLLLDDVHFIESKERTTEELFYTLEHLLCAGAQVVFTADRPPSAMPYLDSRLRDRFESGLVVDLHPPDFDTRLSIVRKRAGCWASTPEQINALELLAQQVSSSVHALEGALIRVRAYASLTQQPLTGGLVERVLANLYAEARPVDPASTTASVELIQQAISAALELPLDDLSSAKRGRQVVYARQVAMYLTRELTDLSLPAIGKRFGGRDHSTVLHAHRQVRARMITDSSTRQLVDNILKVLDAQVTSS